MARSMGRLAASCRFGDLPPAVVERSRLVWLDCLGAIVAGAAEPEMRAARDASGAELRRRGLACAHSLFGRHGRHDAGDRRRQPVRSRPPRDPCRTRHSGSRAPAAGVGPGCDPGARARIRDRCADRHRLEAQGRHASARDLGRRGRGACHRQAGRRQRPADRLGRQHRLVAGPRHQPAHDAGRGRRSGTATPASPT